MTEPVTEPAFARIGPALRLLRQRQGSKQGDVAARAGVTRPMLSAYETGKQRPTLDTLERILAALDATGAELAFYLYLLTVEPEARPASTAGPLRARDLKSAPAALEESHFREAVRAVVAWMSAVRWRTLQTGVLQRYPPSEDTEGQDPEPSSDS